MKKQIGIIGGGVSGLLVAINLLRKASDREVAVSLIERDFTQTARGVAYSPHSKQHLLNVIAGRMSAFSTQPDHFVKWLEVSGYNFSAQDFVPRYLYGKYLDAQKELLLKDFSGRFNIVHDSIFELKKTDQKIILKGSTHQSTYDQVVLAIGNQAPADLPVFVSLSSQLATYYSNPWKVDARELLEHESIAIIGSGLTSFDLIIDLIKLDYQGKIHVFSRRGLRPQPHPNSFTALSSSLPELTGGLQINFRKFVRWLRSDPGNWQLRFDLIRPQTQHLWQNLTLKEQQRFLRHLAPFWDTHRHRVDPAIYALVQKEVFDNKLRFIAARIVSAKHNSVSNQIELNYKLRGGRAGVIHPLNVGAVINCTGPDSLGRSKDPLLVNLLASGQIVIDQLGIGVETTAEGRVFDADRNPSNIWTLAALKKGQLWESNAVNEIRAQAEALAKVLLA